LLVAYFYELVLKLARFLSHSMMDFSEPLIL
jgi:hypothetical protein